MISFEFKKRGLSSLIFIAVAAGIIILSATFLVHLSGRKPKSDVSVATTIENKGHEVANGGYLAVSSEVIVKDAEKVLVKYEITQINKQEIVWKKDAQLSPAKDKNAIKENISMKLFPPGTYRLKVTVSVGEASGSSYSTFIVKEKGKILEPVENNFPENLNISKNETENSIENAHLPDKNNVSEPKCEDNSDQEKKDECFSNLAQETEKLELCFKIGYGAMKDGCIAKFAVDDPSLCDKIGDEYQQEACKKLVEGKNE